MIGERAGSLCPICGGTLEFGRATVPFIFEETVIVVKNVPADICADCHEVFMVGEVTDHITTLLSQLRQLHSEVSVITYSEAVTA